MYLFPPCRIACTGVSLDLRSHLLSGAFSMELSVAFSTPLHIFRPSWGPSTPVLPAPEYCILLYGFPTPALAFVIRFFINSPPSAHFERTICFLPGVRLIHDWRFWTHWHPSRLI